MRVNLVCVGTRMPGWVEEGVAEYRKRLPRDFELLITEVPLSRRGKGQDPVGAVDREGEACLRQVGRDDFVIALDVLGQPLDTPGMAGKFKHLRDEGRHRVTMLIGGPEGLSQACLVRADARWSLSPLTFPHPVVRVLVAEQLYRVWSLLSGHPYHRP